ncbi:MAG: hypothetical protein S4CHLAM7_08440 [Chlamydiae bacterium]|nr:hypothetical protein [Chlamydiota bacterium]
MDLLNKNELSCCINLCYNGMRKNKTKPGIQKMSLSLDNFHAKCNSYPQMTHVFEDCLKIATRSWPECTWGDITWFLKDPDNSLHLKNFVCEQLFSSKYLPVVYGYMFPDTEEDPAFDSLYSNFFQKTNSISGKTAFDTLERKNLSLGNQKITQILARITSKKFNMTFLNLATRTQMMFYRDRKMVHWNNVAADKLIPYSDLDHIDSDGCSSLAYACGGRESEASLKMVKQLLKAGANMYVGSVPAWVRSVIYRNLETFKLLVNQGLDLESKSSEGHTPLIFSAQIIDPFFLKFLLSKGAEVDAQNSKGSTALLEAASSGLIDYVKLLIKAGANTERVDHEGNILVSLAQRSKEAKMKNC